MELEQPNTSHRKLLAHGKTNYNIFFFACLWYFLSSSHVFFFSWLGSCTSRDISISQSRDSTSGIPEYIVQIVNTCVFGCAPSNIHLYCGWFASTRIISPMTFKRLSYDDCLVNGGKPLRSSQIIRFTYSNSFMYPLSLRYAKFCWPHKAWNPKKKKKKVSTRFGSHYYV